MNHEEAEKSEAVERYILNEMGDDERDRFEEHYFDCRDCGAGVFAGERLIAGGRALVKPVVVPFVARHSWTMWLPAAAAAMLVVIAGLQYQTRRTAPSPLPSLERVSETFITGESRGAGEPPITLRAGASDHLLVVPIKPDWEYAQYEFQLRRTDGKVDLTVRMTAEQAKDQASLLPRSLPAGSYVLAIRGVRTDGNRPVIATYAVRVQ